MIQSIEKEEKSRLGYVRLIQDSEKEDNVRLGQGGEKQEKIRLS